MKHLTKREQRTILVGGALAIVILWVYSAYIIGPMAAKIADLGTRVRSAGERLRGLEAVVANEAVIRRQHDELNQSVTSLRNLLPSENELPLVIERLSDLAAQADVKIQSIFPQRPPAAPDAGKAGAGAVAAAPVVYTDIIIQIDAVSGYHQLGTLLSLVETDEHPMQLDSLRMTVNPKDPALHRVKLLVRSYFAAAAAPSS